MSHAGRFVWRELVANNPASVAAFYADLFGWNATSVEMGQPEPYTMLRHPGLDEDVGGATAPAMEGVPPHWLDYISVDDVDASLATVAEHGGTALTPAIDIPVGRFAVVKDPSGAVLALFTSKTPGASDTERTPPVGTFCWSQLMSDHLDQVVPFYEAVFGWTAARQDSGQVWFSRGDKVVASAMPKPNPQAPDAWLQYVAVDDTDAAFAKAQTLGAQPYSPPMDIPGMGRFAIMGDPGGATFAIWKNT